jgi:guanylate kinase
MSSSGRKRRPLLIVLSAPSGAGKTTVCERLTQTHPDIVRSVSCTTRAPRGGEEHGKAYFFLTGPEFDQRLAEDAFLEHATVHGFRYGTLRRTVEEGMRAGKTVVLTIDVQGAEKVRSHIAALPVGDSLRRGFVDIFLKPPSMEVLRQRLTRRGEDLPDVIERRLRNAEDEIAQRDRFQYQVVNDDIERTVREVRDIVEREQDWSRVDLV